jgi:2-polyprenyl-3-methyl-5-hydroxy-6-metoxy-1,4-benzoquinol methylase
MCSEKHPFQEIVEHNIGFATPDLWLDYAQRHGFERVRAVKISCCPDCSGRPRARDWGQQVYYSTLMHFLECADCGLIWADAHIDPETVHTHFEVTYKDEEYFSVARHSIFGHLGRVIDQLCPPSGSVLDIGGARGDLMAEFASRRPDATIVVNDISEAATRLAESKWGFATLTGGATELAQHAGKYDVVVLSDVLYYEPNLRLLWSALSRLISAHGSVVIRVPNKYPLMRVGQFFYRLTRSKSHREMQDRIRFLNPEHIFIFRPKYLRRRLRQLHFNAVQFLPSPPLTRASGLSLGTALFRLMNILNKLTLHRMVLTPAMLVVGTRRASLESPCPQRSSSDLSQ